MLQFALSLEYFPDFQFIARTQWQLYLIAHLSQRIGLNHFIL